MSQITLNLSNKILVAFYFIVGLIICMFSLLGFFIQTSIWIENVENAKVIEWTQNGPDYFVKLEFFNKHDSSYHTVKKQVRQRSVAEFRDKSEIAIRYSKFFPSNIRIVGMGENDFIIELIGIALGAALCYRAVAVLRKRLKIDDFVG